MANAEITAVYFKEGFCSCRACGLEWKSHQLQPCPRCNEASLHSEAVKLQEKVDEYDESFKLYDSAVRRGTRHWQDAPGNPRGVWPDAARLVAWMADEIDRLKIGAPAQQEKKTVTSELWSVFNPNDMQGSGEIKAAHVDGEKVLTVREIEQRLADLEQARYHIAALETAMLESGFDFGLPWRDNEPNGQISQVPQLKLEATVMRDMLIDCYMDELEIDKDTAHATVDFDFGNRLAAEDDSTVPQQHPDNGGLA